MQRFSRFAVFSLTLIVAACASTGGTIGGLVPAPKILKGSIDNNVYTSKGGTFTVAVPHAQGSNEYRYMHVKEEYKDDYTYVSFGPAATDQSIYRVNLVMRQTPGSMDPSLDQMAPQLIGTVEQQAQKAYDGDVTVTSNGKTGIDGHNVYYWQLKQVAPAGKVGNSAPVTLVHDVYAIDFGYAIATVWVQSEAGAPADAERMTPILFAASLKLLPPVNDATRRVAADGIYTFPKHPVSVTSPVMLCGLQGLTVYESDTSVDFAPPDYLWQLGGEYTVQAFPRPKTVTDKQSFLAASQQYFSGYVPGDRKNLGVALKLTGTTGMDVGGLPAMQATGVDEGKAMLVATAILGKSRVMVVSVMYPLHTGDDASKIFPWACYGKFLGSVRETD